VVLEFDTHFKFFGSNIVKTVAFLQWFLFLFVLKLLLHKRFSDFIFYVLGCITRLIVPCVAHLYLKEENRLPQRREGTKQLLSVFVSLQSKNKSLLYFSKIFLIICNHIFDKALQLAIVMRLLQQQ